MKMLSIKEAMESLAGVTHVSPESIQCLCACICDLDARITAVEDRVTALEVEVIPPEEHEEKHKTHKRAQKKAHK